MAHKNQLHQEKGTPKPPKQTQENDTRQEEADEEKSAKTDPTPQSVEQKKEAQEEKSEQEHFNTLEEAYEKADTNTATDEDAKMIGVINDADMPNDLKIKFLVTKLRQAQRDIQTLENRAGLTQGALLRMQQSGAIGAVSNEDMHRQAKDQK